MGRRRVWPRTGVSPECHFDPLVDGSRLIGELLEGELELAWIDALRTLTKHPLAEHVQLLPECRVLALQRAHLLLQRRDQRTRGLLTGRRAERLVQLLQSTTECARCLRDALVPTPPPRVRKIDTREQEQQIGTAELDAWGIVVDRPRDRAAL